jgi:RiboL-PSP-HEPN
MVRAKQQFKDSIVRVKTLDALFTHLHITLHFRSIEIDDLLRSEIVYIVSALDKLIHELVRIGMLQSFSSTRLKTASYSKFPLNLNVLTNINSGAQPPTVVFERHIIDSHSHLAFQDPEKIANALSLIWSEIHKWQRIAVAMGTNEADLKTQLKNIVIRRNQIVHESDLDLSTGDIQPILQTDVQDIVNFIELLGETICSLV